MKTDPKGSKGPKGSIPWRAETLAVFCLAVWLTGTICVAVVATQNFFTVDRLMTSSPSQPFRMAVNTLDSVETPGHPVARDLLRYLSAELNRIYFQYWNVAQTVVGIITLWLVTKIPGANRAKWCVVGMLGVSLFLMLVLTPPIISVGRSLDFVPRESPPQEVVAALRKFGLLHVTYTVMTMINLVLGVLSTIWVQRPQVSRPDLRVVEIAR
jgi:hypothetical protein